MLFFKKEEKMYNANQNMIDNLLRQKDRIDEMIKGYQQPQPVNNFITTAPTQNKDMVEWRILGEKEEVENLYVGVKTLFINDEQMVLKGTDGSLERWEIKKVYPIDKKDEKINALEEEIKKLKEMVNNEHKQPDEPTREIKQPDGDADGNANRKSATNGGSIQKQK